MDLSDNFLSCVVALDERGLKFRRAGSSASERVPLGRLIMGNQLFLYLPKDVWKDNRVDLETITAIAGFDGK